MALDQARATSVLTWMHGGAAPSALTGSSLALMTTQGTATAAGTEVTGGSYARQTISWAAASAGSQASNAAVNFTNMPATTVVSVEVYATSTRVEYTTSFTSKTTNAGDTLSFASAAITSQFP
jgi:hypothetical protein